jgi:hypothetical protein
MGIIGDASFRNEWRWMIPAKYNVIQSYWFRQREATPADFEPRA